MKSSKVFWVLLSAFVFAATFAARAYTDALNEADEAQALREANETLAKSYCEAAYQRYQLEKQRDAAIEELEQAKQGAGDHGAEVHGRVVDLPEDAEALHTILFVQPDFATRPNELKAKQLFDSQPWCLDLRARTHWHFWTIDLPEAKPYWKFVTKTPCLMIIDGSGQAGRVIYNEANPDLAKQPAGLLSKINVTRKRQRHGQTTPFTGPCPDGVCPDQQKTEPINPPPQNLTLPAEPETRPEIKPGTPAADKSIPIGVAAAIAAVVGLFGFVAFTVFGKAEGIAKAYRSAR